MHKATVFAAGLALAFAASAASAKEYPIGKPKTLAGMEIAAVYLQPVTMDPDGACDIKDADVHLEADIKATKDNKNGFAEGDWVPYLFIKYELTKEGAAEPTKGEFLAMVASDGPHYGENVKLSGPGKYKLKFTIAPPSENPRAAFHRHTDKETGVAEWFKTFSVDYEFTFAGFGKKGAY
jgi:uncharacterized protein involved in high-affinity Fe2+ transport|uniref:Conserved hypothetical membrane antigen n=1 Tax=Rhodopseudomonas palustris (strain BisA53) TaxID=316055 RepID=Q07ME8_RHOP5